MEPISWLETMQTAMRLRPEYTAKVSDEAWSSIPLPRLETDKIAVVTWFGTNVVGPDGRRLPGAPVLRVLFLYPGNNMRLEPPPAGMAPTAKEHALLRDPEVLAKMKEHLKTRGDDMVRHKELLDEFLRKQWWNAKPGDASVKAAALEWKQVLDRLLAPHFEWLYLHEAKFIREWIASHQ
jgi:hypothetical protein